MTSDRSPCCPVAAAEDPLSLDPEHRDVVVKAVTPRTVQTADGGHQGPQGDTFLSQGPCRPHSDDLHRPPLASLPPARPWPAPPPVVVASMSGTWQPLPHVEEGWRPMGEGSGTNILGFDAGFGYAASSF